jgi:DNA-binding CsgD family transcriptional regulator
VRITLDLQAAVAAAHEGLELARRLDDRRGIARFEVWTALDASAREQVDEMVRLATAGLVHGRASDDPVAVIYASRLLLSLPVDLRPTVDPPLPSLHALLEQCEQHGQPLAGMVVLADLAEDAAASRDLPSAATWLWRHLMAAATVARTDPFATLGGLVAAASLAMEAGDLEEAVRLRESVREFDFTLPVMMGADRARSHLHRLAALEQRVPPEHYAALAADVADRTLVEANRHAQLVTRSLSRLEAEEPRTSSDEAADRVGLLAVERAAIQRPGVLVEPLTPREREVLAHLSTGATNSQIAAALFVSPKTVMHHAAAIYRKLGVRGRAAATAWAVREGIASG